MLDTVRGCAKLGRKWCVCFFFASCCMSILIVCPGCHKRFKVDERFAGKTGACPSCKSPIRVPTKDEEVQIHAPGEAAAEGAPGSDIVIKPIERLETKWSPVTAAAMGGAVVASLLVAWLGGATFQESSWARAIGLLLISPPLVVAGYALLRESEDLDPYRGKELLLRAGICSLVYVILWWAYGYVSGQLLTGELWIWFYVVLPFFLIGGLAALSCLDLDYTSGFLHYCFYVAATVLLRAVAGLGWIWQMPNDMTTLGMF